MLIAEIRKKLADLEDIDPEEGNVLEQLKAILKETKEDLLTSDVFGALKYLPRIPYLSTVLRTIADRNPHSEKFRKVISKLGNNIESLNFDFWPSIPTPTGLPGAITEPDVQISGTDLLIFFEAKLYSQFGELQIERELAAGLEFSGQKEFFLVLVTLNTSIPTISSEGRRVNILSYLKNVSPSSKIKKNIANQLRSNFDRVLYISWHSVLSALYLANEQHATLNDVKFEEIRRCTDIIEDLKLLMLMRNIQPFNGFAFIAKGAESLHIDFPILFDTQLDQRLSFSAIKWENIPWLNKFIPLPKSGYYVFHRVKPYQQRRINFPKIVLNMPYKKDLTTVTPWIYDKKKDKNVINLQNILTKRDTENLSITQFLWRKK